MLFMASVMLGLTIRFCTKHNTAPSNKILCAFQLASFLMSMCFIYLICEVIVELLELFGNVTGLPRSFLGLTILSWGNSLGDYFASVSLSQVGLGEMAITGCMAGPIFNLMLGLGVTSLVCNLQTEGGIKFDLSKDDGQATLATVFATLFIHILLAWIVFTNDFKIEKKHAILLSKSYFGLMIMVALATLF